MKTIVIFSIIPDVFSTVVISESKCHVLHVGKKNSKYQYEWGGGYLEKTTEEKDVGVLISDTLKPSLQCAKAASKANLVLGQMSRAISYGEKFYSIAVQLGILSIQVIKRF